MNKVGNSVYGAMVDVIARDGYRILEWGSREGATMSNVGAGKFKLSP